jgi:parallel beta-helix repeat protein
MHTKSLVYALILFLFAASFVGLFSPAKADTWTDITLPYTVTEAGNYRVTSTWTGAGVALSINASNVVVDGQNRLITLTQAEGNYAVVIAPGSQNVLLENLNQTCSDYGVYAEEGNFTTRNSMFTNNTSAGVFAFNVTGFTLQDSRLSNNSYGVVTVDAGNFSVQGCHVKNNTAGVQTVNSANFTLTQLYLNNNTETFNAQGCLNFNFTDCTLNDNEYGLSIFESGQLNVQNCEFNNTALGFFASLSNFTFTDSSLNYGVVGFEALACDDFLVANVSITNNEQAFMSMGNNFTLQDFNFNHNQVYNAMVFYSNATIRQGILANALCGLVAEDNNRLTVEDCVMDNNTWFGVFLGDEINTTLNSNLFSDNGFFGENYMPLAASAVAIVDSNVTVSNNLFQNNNDTLLWSAYYEDDNCTVDVFNNNFQNNNYTLFFDYELPNSTNQQFNFYNNLVNDTTYVDPQSFTIDGLYAPSEAVFYLNTTFQAGNRIYPDGGRMIGGNYWAHPDGTGPSQTGVDADHDGFLDEPLDFFGNQTVYDYLPLSSNFVEYIDHLTISPETASVTVGDSVTYTTTAYDQYGNAWNVTADYFIEDIPFSEDTLYANLPVGGYVITASYHDKTATALLYVVQGSLDHFAVYAPATAVANTPFNIQVVAQDNAGNIAAFSGTVTLSVNDSSVTPQTSGDFRSGIWSDSVTLSEAAVVQITVNDGNGHTGTSNAITVVSQAATPTPAPTPTPSPTTQPTATPDNTQEGPAALPPMTIWVIIIGIVAIVVVVGFLAFRRIHK